MHEVEQLVGLPLTSDYLEHPKLAIGEEYIPDDIRAVVYYGLAAALELGEATEVSHTTKVHLTMLQNLERFIHDRQDGMNESELHTHQQDIFNQLYSFLANPPQTNDGDFERKGYLKMPTGSGKTAIFTTLIGILNKPVSDTEPKLKALVLVPKLDLVTQTIGEEVDGNTRGFTRFANDTTTSEYHGKRKDLSGDAVIMTYRSFNKLVQANQLPHDLFDMVVCDEAHNTLGTGIRSSLESYSADKLLIGVTATLDYAANKSVADVFNYEIASVGLREAIEAGFLAPIQCLAIRSDEKIESLGQGSADFSSKELAQLIVREWRNQQAVEFAKQFVAEGRQGLISCVPGQELAHAKLIAEQLRQEFILDPQSGELRRISAVAVGSYTKPEERQRIYEAYERGDIDVLTYVDILTEGWDSTAAKFLVNLRPTTSPVNAVQRLGRILRPGEHNELATVVEFVDDTERPIYTVFQALGIEEIDMRFIYGSQTSAKGGIHDGGIDIDSLPDELCNRLKQIDHMLVNDLIVQPVQFELPDGVVSISSFAKSLAVGNKTIMNIVYELGIEPDVYRFGNNNIDGYGLTAEDQALIKLHEFFDMPVAGDEIMSIFAFGVSSGFGRTAIKQAMTNLGMERRNYRFKNNMDGFPGLTEQERTTISQHIVSLAAEFTDEIITQNQLAHELNSSNDMLAAVMAELGISPNTYFVGGRTAPGLDREQVGAILAHPHYNIPQLSDQDVRYVDLGKELHMENLKMKSVLEELGIEIRVLKQGGHRVRTLTLEEAAAVRSHVAETMPLPPAGTIKAAVLAARHGVTLNAVLKTAGKLGIASTMYRYVRSRGAAMAPGFDAKEGELLSVELIDLVARRVETLQKNAASEQDREQRGRQQRAARIALQYTVVTEQDPIARSVYSIAGETGISEKRIITACKDLGVSVETYSFNNKQGVGIATADISRLFEHRSFNTPESTNEFISINQAARQLGTDPSRIRRVLEENGQQAVQLRSHRKRITGHITLDVLEALSQMPEFSAAIATDGTKSIYEFSKLVGVSEKMIRAIAAEYGVPASQYKIKRAHGYARADGLTAEQQDTILQHPYFAIPQAAEDITSITVAAKNFHLARQSVVKLANEIGISLNKYKFGAGKVTLGLTQEQYQALAQAVAAR